MGEVAVESDGEEMLPGARQCDAGLPRGTVGSVRLRNLTPHPVTISARGGRRYTIEPDGPSARVEVDVEELPPVQVDGGEVALKRELLGAVVGLPDPEPGVLIVVSRIVLDAAPDRTDLVCPTDFQRDGQGRILSAAALAVSAAFRIP